MQNTAVVMLPACASLIFNSTLALKAVQDKNGTEQPVWPAYLRRTARLRRQINRIR